MGFINGNATIDWNTYDKEGDMAKWKTTARRIRFAARGIASALLILIALAVGTTALSGCSGRAGADGGGGNVAFVMQNTANAPSWDASASGAVAEARAAGSKAFVIVADGDPAVEGKTDFGETADSKLNADKAERKLKSALTGSRAGQPEADVWRAIEVAAEALEGPGRIEVFSGGLATAGLLDFASSDLIEADPADIVSFYEARGQLPRMDGVSVTWYGLGSVSGSQAAPSTAQKRALQAIWQAMLEACGADVAFAGSSVAGAYDASGLPAVSTVPLPAEAVFSASGEGRAITFSATQLRFVGDEATFVDEAEASQALSGVADILVSSPNLKATVTASCAGAPTGEGSFGQLLSERRAERVRQALVSLGVDGSRITAVGVGANGADHVPDVDGATGELIPAAAAQNRKVVIEIA